MANMTDAMSLVMEGDFVRGVQTLFTDTSGAPFFYFVLLSMLCVLIYVGSESAALAAIVFVVFAGALVAGPLTMFHGNYQVIPEPFQGIVILAVLIALFYIIWQAWTRR